MNPKPFPALLKVNGDVVAMNDEGKQYEEVLGSIVEEHSHSGFPMEAFEVWMLVNRPDLSLHYAADNEGALYVMIEYVMEQQEVHQ